MSTAAQDFITEANTTDLVLNLHSHKFDYPIYRIDEFVLSRLAKRNAIDVEALRSQLQSFVAAAINEKIEREKGERGERQYAKDFLKWVQDNCKIDEWDHAAYFKGERDPDKLINSFEKGKTK